MNSSSSSLHKFGEAGSSMIDPGFALILAFDYYDGPERGLAIYPSGDGVRFSSLGDSKSRLFRAFELIPVKGSWWSKIRALQETEGVNPMRRILLPLKTTKELTQLENDVVEALTVGQFIGVGSPGLEKLAISQVTQEELARLRELGCSPTSFELAHQLVKKQSATKFRILNEVGR